MMANEWILWIMVGILIQQTVNFILVQILDEQEATLLSLWIYIIPAWILSKTIFSSERILNRQSRKLIRLYKKGVTTNVLNKKYGKFYNGAFNNLYDYIEKGENND